jgi:hypothetical protein
MSHLRLSQLWPVRRGAARSDDRSWLRTSGREWIGAGDVPELAKARHLDFADIDSGHWPMVTKPIELARFLAAAAAED